MDEDNSAYLSFLCANDEEEIFSEIFYLDKMVQMRVLTLKFARNMFNQFFEESLDGQPPNFCFTQITCSITIHLIMNARLVNATFNYSAFMLSSMVNSNLSHGFFIDISFENVNLDGTDFSGAVFQRGTFLHVSMVNCSISGAILNETRFSYVNLTGCGGFEDKQMHTMLINDAVILPNGTFVNSSFITRHFRM